MSESPRGRSSFGGHGRDQSYLRSNLLLSSEAPVRTPVFTELPESESQASLPAYAPNEELNAVKTPTEQPMIYTPGAYPQDKQNAFVDSPPRSFQQHASQGSLSSTTPSRAPIPPSPVNRKFVLALDFGTTRTGVAFSSGPSAANASVELILNYGPNMTNEPKVKSAISYSHEGIQWGSNIADQRIAMINMKLELETSQTRLEELDLTLQLLRRLKFLDVTSIMKNEFNDGFSAKPPEEIITEYLQQVFSRARARIEEIRLTETQTPIDFVMTVPASWSPEAQNLLYRAVRGAGFNRRELPTLRDTMIVTEPEAAVQSTMRELLGQRIMRIKDNDCFILVDAGGGTVDLISFRARWKGSRWDFEVVTQATGGPVGSAIIDTEFKRWLKRKVLTGDYSEYYDQLDPANAHRDQTISPNGAETGPMRTLIRRFENEKIVFGRSADLNKDITIDMPAPLEGIDVPNHIEQGALKIKG